MYRVKQFIWAIKSIVEEVDYKFVDKFLSIHERQLFNKLSKSDKHHSIRVSKDAIDIIEKSNYDVKLEKVAKAALLHDIGKIDAGLNIFEKSIMVILDKASKGKFKKYSNIKQVDIYYNHPEKGIDLLKKIDIYDKEFLDSIRYHHEVDKSNNIILEIIRESDNRN